jgi:lysyl-tRNA synthetase class 2
MASLSHTESKAPGSSAEEIRALRLEKLHALRERGVDPYPARTSVTHTVAEALAAYESLAEAEETVSLAGRLTARRGHGKTTFADLRDGTGRIQIYLKRDDLGEEAYSLLDCVDVGDFLGVDGRLFTTRMGERTLHVTGLTVLAKSLLPLPEKWHGLKDKETRYRKRYLDLVVNPDVRRVFEVRAGVIRSFRETLDAEGYLEVETPILQPLYGGANARPFKTHHRALDQTLYLRIADELYLKRLIVGGLDRVYEFCKDFRNEGMDRLHNPEFTMLELYRAYADYEDMMQLTERLVSRAAQAVLGTMRVPVPSETGGEAGEDGAEPERVIDLTPPWRRVTVREALREHAGVDLAAADTEALLARCRELDLGVDPGASRGELIGELMDACVEPELQEPTFLIDYPREISPLAKRKADDPDTTERFEPFVLGHELGNAFSELNDPLDQRARFEEQVAAGRGGDDDEHHPYDEDYVTALEHGMPPTGGLGIGVDRVVMLLAGRRHIRDVILFPHLRPEAGAEDAGADDADDGEG